MKMGSGVLVLFEPWKITGAAGLCLAHAELQRIPSLKSAWENPAVSLHSSPQVMPPCNRPAPEQTGFNILQTFPDQ